MDFSTQKTPDRVVRHDPGRGSIQINRVQNTSIRTPNSKNRARQGKIGSV